MDIFSLKVFFGSYANFLIYFRQQPLKYYFIIS